MSLICICILGSILLTSSIQIQVITCVKLPFATSQTCMCMSHDITSEFPPKRTESLPRTRARPPVLVKGLGKPTVQIVLRGPRADVHLLSGRLISTLTVDPNERFSTLRERARATLTEIFTEPETVHAQFSSNGWKLESNFLRRKVRKAQLK